MIQIIYYFGHFLRFGAISGKVTAGGGPDSMSTGHKVSVYLKYTQLFHLALRAF